MKLSIKTSSMPNPSSPEQHEDLDFRYMAMLYVLGDLLDDAPLRDSTVKRILTMMRDKSAFPSLATLKYIWESTPSMSMLRKMLVEVFTNKNPIGFMHPVENYTVEFTQEVAAALMSQPRRQVSWPDLVGRIGEWMAPVDLTVEGD